MTIHLVTGLPGFGKTLRLCQIALKAMNQGKHVKANFNMINLKHPHLFTHYNDPLEVLGKSKNCLILMSEVGILLDQQIMYEIPRDTWVELRQHRKDGVNIYADAQSHADVAWTFMKLVQFQHHIYSKYNLPGDYFFTFSRTFNPQPKGEDYGRRYNLVNARKIGYYYDTNYKLEKNPTLFDMSQQKVKSPIADYEKQRFLELVEEINYHEKIS